jgi:hypothetical protein
MQPTNCTFRDHRYIYYVTSPTYFDLLNHFQEQNLILQVDLQDYYESKNKELCVLLSEVVKRVYYTQFFY